MSKKDSKLNTKTTISSEKNKQKEEICVNKIVKAWRSYTNKKIYKYYKDIINFKCKGNPAHLLKAINPAEAQLLDMAANVHVRFRLGGEKFPPNIYYKIYTHGPVCDVNSFAPRDYSLIQREEQEESKNQNSMSGTSKLINSSQSLSKNNISNSENSMNYDQYKLQQKDLESEGWYLRIDNNGWRPISHKTFSKTDYVEVFSANKVHYYHYNKIKRDDKSMRKKRRNKLRWLQKIYLEALKSQNPEIKQLQSQFNDDSSKQEKKQNSYNIEQQSKSEKLLENLNDQIENINKQSENDIEYLNPFEDMRFIEMDEQEFDNEAKQLIEWSSQLDYDSYLKEWYGLSTSNKSDQIIQNYLASNQSQCQASQETDKQAPLTEASQN